MRKLTLMIFAGLLAFAPVAFAPPAQAQRSGPFPYDGNIQSYGGLWRYQKRDWGTPWNPLNPGVCWQFNDYLHEWRWVC
ncbi:MAG: hypothetical protein ACR65X_01145 [Methylocystis sp.]